MLPCNKSPECDQEAVGSLRRFIRKNARGVDPWRISIPAFLRLARTGIAVALVSLAFALPLRAQDYNAPTIAISPGGGLSTTSSLSITIEWCDDSDLQRLTRTITLNDVNVRSSFDFVFGSNPNCGAYATSTGSVTLSPGSNVLSATILDIAENAGGGSTQFTFGVSVTPDAGSAGTVAPFSAQSYGFIVTNTSSTSTAFNLTSHMLRLDDRLLGSVDFHPQRRRADHGAGELQRWRERYGGIGILERRGEWQFRHHR